MNLLGPPIFSLPYKGFWYIANRPTQSSIMQLTIRQLSGFSTFQQEGNILCWLIA